MARGGARVGAGRPKKRRDSEPELTPEEKEHIRLVLAFGRRIEDGGGLTRSEIRELEGFHFPPD